MPALATRSMGIMAGLGAVQVLALLAKKAAEMNLSSMHLRKAEMNSRRGAHACCRRPPVSPS